MAIYSSVEGCLAIMPWLAPTRSSNVFAQRFYHHRTWYVRGGWENQKASAAWRISLCTCFLQLLSSCCIVNQKCDLYRFNLWLKNKHLHSLITCCSFWDVNVETFSKLQQEEFLANRKRIHQQEMWHHSVVYLKIVTAAVPIGLDNLPLHWHSPWRRSSKAFWNFRQFYNRSAKGGAFRVFLIFRGVLVLPRWFAWSVHTWENK